MRRAPLASPVILGLLVLGLTAGSGTADANQTICSREAAHRYHYGVKDTLKFTLPSQDPDAFNEVIEAFADANGFQDWTVGSFDPQKQPGFRSVTHILYTQSSDVTIQVKMTTRSRVAEANVETFSYSCSATEDWRPYWQAFVEFVTRSGYPIVP